MQNALFINWNPDPVAVNLLGLPLRWYSLCWALALLLGYMNMLRLYRRHKIPDEVFAPLFMYIFIGVLLGARVGHCLFYEPGYYLNHIVEMLLPIHRTATGWTLSGYQGLASHGGALGMMVAIWIYCRRQGMNIMRVLDYMGIIVPLSAAFIRLGNLFNSEMVGTPTTASWGFVFAANGEDFARHPAQLYEALFYLLVFVAVIVIFRMGGNERRVGKGFFFGFCLTAIFGFRIVVEFLKADQIAAEADMLLNMGQLLSIPMVLLGIYCMCGGRYCLRLGEHGDKPQYRKPQTSSHKK